MKRLILNKWGLGLIVSLLFAFFVSNIFMDSLYSHEYDPVLKNYVYTHGTTYRKREEGWASTSIGKHNICAVRDIATNISDKVAIWGDSEVEAFCVPDEFKMAQQTTRFFQERGLNRLAFAVGHNYLSLSDHYFDIPKYEGLISNIVAHYIILCDFSKALPNGGGGYFESFFYKNGFQLTESDYKPPSTNLLYYLSKYNLRFIVYITGRLKESFRSTFDYQLHQTNSEPRNNEQIPYNHKDAFNFILTRLKGQTKAPITIVYCPRIPAIKDNLVLLEDPSKGDKEVYSTICHQVGINFIDLTEPFIRLYLQTNTFPRGFFNSIPSIGHMNKKGHQIVASAIYENESKR